ncbi:FadR/GntR family transcriptional regulator [Terasakiella sp. A23]|uniref:FadR/GntR family transcriptional regulator n=1 Tax=Terasakiella sp. FCG-A23 TaxID=3080561 RepID=UPI00295404C8|nr:FadR/GntR family transcriptional regulator [Terasakiella sp. A23]MDV7337968.1 FadR/GntR family transcriptional regulator [Terasakiella sp. A23]
MGIKYEPLVTESLAKQIAETIRAAIVEGDLKVDERLPTEPELAERFGVSRPTIREALKRLAAQHLIRSRRGPSGGTFVNRPDSLEAQETLSNMTSLLTTMGEFDLSDIAEARRELELICVRQAAVRRDQSHLNAMAFEISVQKNNSIADQDFCASDVRFHRAIVDATQNSMLKFMMTSVIEAVQPIVNLIVFRFWDKEKTVEQHERILASITAGDAEGAAQAIMEQMDDLKDRYSKAQALRDAKN